MSIIYETSGRAREYFELAANLYTGCTHACVYCYGSDVTRNNRRDFYQRAIPRANVLKQLELDAARLSRDSETRHILLSFITDPYQPAEEKEELTRKAIQILHKAGLGVAILTKGGMLAERDFDLLTAADAFGVTLTFINPMFSKNWEPRAAMPYDRMKSLSDAHERGIPTWASMEPVIDPAETLALIEATSWYVDHYKVGTLNYANKIPYQYKVPRVDWKQFAQNVIIMLNRLNKSFYIKKDLGRYVGKPEGISVGKYPK